MPRLSSFLGIVIYMYFKDHNPPHFHAVYGDFETEIAISSLEQLVGKFPEPQLSFVRTWAAFNQAALMRAWEACSKNKHPEKIPPLAKNRKSGKGKR